MLECLSCAWVVSSKPRTESMTNPELQVGRPNLGTRVQLATNPRPKGPQEPELASADYLEEPVHLDREAQIGSDTKSGLIRGSLFRESYGILSILLDPDRVSSGSPQRWLLYLGGL
jgi:hypothetical protein